MNALNHLTFISALRALKKAHYRTTQELEDFISAHRLDDMGESVAIADKFVERTEAIGGLANLARLVEMLRFLEQLRAAVYDPRNGSDDIEINVPHFTSIAETITFFGGALTFGAKETARGLLNTELAAFEKLRGGLESLLDLTSLYQFLTKLHEAATTPPLPGQGYYLAGDNLTRDIRLNLYEHRPNTPTAADLACNDPDCLFHGNDNRRTFIQRWQRLRSLAARDPAWGEPVRIEPGAEQAGSGSSSNGQAGRADLHPKGKPSKSRRRGNRPVVRSNKAKAA